MPAVPPKTVRIDVVGLTEAGFEKSLASFYSDDGGPIYGTDTPGVEIDHGNKKIIFDRTQLPEELKTVEIRITEDW